MTPLAWLSVAGLCALGAMSPGPSLAVVLYHAGRGSRREGIRCALAHAVGVGLYALLTALGLAALLARHEGLYGLVATAGAIYLLWLGQALLRAPAADPGPRPASHVAVRRAPTRDGLVTALLNPKIALFFLALFSQFVGPEPGPAAVAALVLIAMGIDAGWYVLVAVSVSAGGLPARLRRPGSRFDRIFGTVLIVVAVVLLYLLWAR